MIPMLQQMIAGKLRVSDSVVHDWIERWLGIVTLPEYLGMHWEEYRRWFTGKGTIQDIVDRRRQRLKRK